MLRRFLTIFFTNFGGGLLVIGLLMLLLWALDDPLLAQQRVGPILVFLLLDVLIYALLCAAIAARASSQSMAWTRILTGVNALILAGGLLAFSGSVLIAVLLLLNGAGTLFSGLKLLRAVQPADTR